MTLDSQRQEQLITNIVQWVKARKLGTVAVLFLYANKPLAPIGSQALFFLQPILGSLGTMFGMFQDEHALTEYGLLLEDSSNIDQLLSHLER